MFKVIWNRIYGSTPAVFESGYDLEESVRRLKDATVSSIWPSLIIKEVMYGSVSAKRVSLCHLSSPGGYFDDSFSRNMVGKSSYEPYFYGSFRQTEQGVILVGQFTSSLGEKIWSAIATCLTLLLTIYMGWIFLNSPVWWLFLIFLGIVLGNFYKSYYYAQQPLEDITWLTKKINDALSAPEKSDPPFSWLIK